MKNLARAVALSVLSLAVLTGCMRIDMDLTLNPDDTMSGSIVMAVAEGTGESFGISDEELYEQMFSETDSGFPQGEVEEYSQDGYIGQKMTFTDEPFEEFSADTDGMQIYRDGDDYVVESNESFTEGTDVSQLPTDAEATLSVTFPGSVDETNGMLEGTTVTWNLFEDQEALYARGSASADVAFPVWLILLIGLAVGVLIGVVVWLTLRRRSNSTTSDGTIDGAPASFEPDQVAPPVSANPQQPVVPTAAAGMAPDTGAPNTGAADSDVAPTPEHPSTPERLAADAEPASAEETADAKDEDASDEPEDPQQR